MYSGTFLLIINLHHTCPPNPFKSLGYSCTEPGALWPLKCSVHSCVGLEFVNTLLEEASFTLPSVAVTGMSK